VSFLVILLQGKRGGVDKGGSKIASMKIWRGNEDAVISVRSKAVASGIRGRRRNQMKWNILK